ncbi:uncharacterized protein J4E88_002494 [Alternaria novae-zelandiae]|uniref:uncharacterized protein n=1 Tax=Alternaria novae-zelandiae TaxID=430562 RepID=UPI0020C303C7|nr:uncharacterized protein J4E88_002494 [Alternaria novae-zelandiae]KAI4691017.1 hypothetical protein J4E88_002494 [Alternaria novae-zelandiae]
MPASGERERSNRKGQYSCNFCRSRKIRCDRPLPCTSCRSRGKTCQFDPTPAAREVQGPQTPVSIEASLTQQQPYESIQTPFSSTGKPDMQAEIDALQSRVQELEERIIRETTFRPQAGNDTSDSVRTAFVSRTGPDEIERYRTSEIQETRDMVEHLEGVSMSQSSFELPATNHITFKIGQIRTIPSTLSYTTQLGRLTPCIWLPLREEAMTLLDIYITELNYIQHVTHYPSLPATLNEIYRSIESCEPTNPNNIVLFLSIIAHTTHVWSMPDGLNRERPLFISSTQARSQTSIWVKATYTVLETLQEGPSLALEAIQGTIILSYVLYLLAVGPQPSLPLSQYTDMSYFLQRIRLAEISRNFVDQITSDPFKHDVHLMAMDRQLVDMMHETPAFFLLDYYDSTFSSEKPNHTFIQAYFLNTLIHTQRCKLHLTSLTRPSASMTISTSPSSRTACLHSARQLIYLETKLLQSRHPFAHRPQRPPAGLYSIFIATIALLMDACLNRSGELRAELQQENDLAKGLQMIADAREDSLAAAKLYESLMQIVEKHRGAGSMIEGSPKCVDKEIALETFHDSPLNASQEHHSSSQINDAIQLDLADWDDLLSSVSSSPFF